MYYCKLNEDTLSIHSRHQEALWELMNVHTKNLTREEANNKGYWIMDENNWVFQKPECPECKKPGGYVSHLEDAVFCHDCGVQSLYTEKLIKERKEAFDKWIEEDIKRNAEERLRAQLDGHLIFGPSF